MQRTVGEESFAGSMPEGYHPCIFMGEKDLDNGAAVAVFKVMTPQGPGLKAAGFNVDLYLTLKEDNSKYKKSALEEILIAVGKKDSLQIGQEVRLPKFGSDIPSHLQVPVDVYLKRDKNNYLRPWTPDKETDEQRRTVRPWSPVATTAANGSVAKPGNPW